ncbi:MAG: DUF349 domain-containing protein [Prevotellaceae bacterium]|jgi:hypothetical protein|nr:DUF349 domain-containing protein [Prevotellaceae bacterium]
MDQENTIPAPEEQFKGQLPEETTINEVASDQEDTPQPVAEEAPTEAPAVHNFSNFSLPEILLEFDRLLNQKDSTELMKNAELLKSFFYKGLRRERGENLPPDDHEVGIEGEEDAEVEDVEVIEVADTATIADNGPKEKLLYQDEENAFKHMYAKYKSLRIEYAKHLEMQKEHNLQLKQAIIDELKALVEKQEDLNHTFPEFRHLQTRWKEVGPVPIGNTKDIWDTYQHYVEKFYDYVKINNELRDLDFKKNLEQKTILCEKAEELLVESSILSAFRKLQKLHEEWRESGPVARECREQIWNRFKAATSAINKKHQAYFDEQKENQKQNYETKIALCEKAEEIINVESNDANEWNKRSKEVENLQKLWRTVGFASKKDNQKVYDRFRVACNKFYDAKRHFYSQYKHDMHDNYDRKIALCEQAEALQNSDEWRKTSDLLMNLQRQWKETGPVPRKQSDLVWKRFRTACDAFFENKAKHFHAVDDNYEDNLKRKEAILEEIRKYEHTSDSNNDLTAFKEFQRRWAEVGFVPKKDKERIQTAYTKALDVGFSTLRAAEGERRPNKFKRRNDDMHVSGKQERTFRSEREKLLYKFRQMESDIALWENNLGFFTKSKNADTLLADMNHKISLAKEELMLLEEKIKTMDKQFE